PPPCCWAGWDESAPCLALWRRPPESNEASNRLSPRARSPAILVVGSAPKRQARPWRPASGEHEQDGLRREACARGHAGNHAHADPGIRPEESDLASRSDPDPGLPLQ